MEDRVSNLLLNPSFLMALCRCVVPNRLYTQQKPSISVSASSFKQEQIHSPSFQSDSDFCLINMNLLMLISYTLGGVRQKSSARLWWCEASWYSVVEVHTF